ncbi:hypothetical protein OH786_22590 [Streptomyces atratus]|uniref:Uncharacterized protein n=1 Tax=Streptomyces atratus TaxID=1893 RepID=A0A1K1WD84_STRAR|nr:hypothetical protein [Streptomyces atratus]SFX35328.1 hypothetical protein SAMN02787144_1002403 [Streptomyces atratus]
MDWRAWHDAYGIPDSWLARRLRAVRGRDLIDVLADHSRRDGVRARLVELDPGNTAPAREPARRAGLTRVEVVTGDASLADHYAQAARP